jgi:manganese oxidase
MPWGDGPDVDVITPGDADGGSARLPFTDLHGSPVLPCHREFTVFLHDEPEIHSGLHVGNAEHTVMPLSYRAEPMPNRLPHRMRRYAEATSAEPAADQVGVDHAAVRIELDEELGEVFRVARTPEGEFLERVAGEEQHHSSWLFGDPVTPIFHAYAGDPARVRIVHAGIKETHVFHLHVHQWRAVPQDTAAPSVWRPGEPRGSQLLDSITIGPQTAVTIDPLYGSGSRQHAPGDVIWHCHLYPHFHHGMWGLWRSFDRLVDGSLAYPDGTPSRALQPLPGRTPPSPEPDRPGFPWFIDAAFPQKSPPPPALLEEHVGGRRRLLRMPRHSAHEHAAMPVGVKARPRGGAVFVDLDGDAVAWNAGAGLPPPRIVSYDVEVRESGVEYNAQGWHDLRGHHYRITGISVSQLDEHGDVVSRREHPVPVHGVEPFFPRANHGDVVELRLHNRLATIPPDAFDLRTPPVECGLHVHLVKFDVLSADGSSTGWNYLAGASCPETVGPDLPGKLPSNVVLHRWVVDEEFGPCFFHDHLLANYRQKHGLFAALIAEPHGAQWLRPDQEEIAWSGPQAVITAPHDSYREACLAVGDFIPLHDAHGRALNPPGELGGDDDPGAMGVNYRCSPLTFRGDDPSTWFAASQGEPDTELVETYAGDRLRIRLVQGSHEEQHAFATHGLRWRREWQDPSSALVDQQTIGISEAFTLDLDDARRTGYGPGDHLWHFAALDDLWLGCWGIVRAFRLGAPDGPPPLPEPWRTTLDAPPRPVRPPVPPRPARRPDGTWTAPVREFVVAARRIEHRYAGDALTDPWGLVYEVATGWRELPDVPGRPRGRRVATGVRRTGEPLVLRARRGEWVRVTLINEVLDDRADDPRRVPFGIETNPPWLPLEELDPETGYPVARTVTPRVSLHPGLLRYDVVADDGANVGRNHDGTVAAPAPPADGHGAHGGGTVVVRHGHGGSHGDPNWREYWWYADEELAPESHEHGPGQVCLLRDAADVRDHRHHGLVGALVVEPGDVTPLDPRTRRPRWWGAHALIADGLRDVADGAVDEADVVANEQVLILQDGLRLFVAGNPDLPVRDVVVGDDPEDAGQKGINYRCALVHPDTMLRDRRPPTPVWPARVGQPLWLRLVCAADKPRNHTFTVHGQAWDAAPWLESKPAGRAWTGALSGITAGYARDVVLSAAEPGDHAYRSGVFRWAVENGMWGILRVEP